jgi:hypothetical protein
MMDDIFLIGHLYDNGGKNELLRAISVVTSAFF